MYLDLLTNNQVSVEANKFFLDIFQKKGYTMTGKSIQITAENIIRLKDQTVAGSWFMMVNSATAPTAALGRPLYYGNLFVKTFVQAFTSGTLDKRHGLAHVDNAGAAISYMLSAKTGLGAAESGNPSDANYTADRLTKVLFSDVEAVYGTGAAPVGTIRTQIEFTGFKIALV